VLERGARLALAKSEGAEGAEDLCIDIGRDWVDDSSVRRAIGVAKDEAGGDSALDDELPPVLGSVVGGAQGDERVRIVIAALGAP